MNQLAFGRVGSASSQVWNLGGDYGLQSASCISSRVRYDSGSCVHRLRVRWQRRIGWSSRRCWQWGTSGGGSASPGGAGMSRPGAGTGTVLPPTNAQGTNTQGPATQGTATQGGAIQGDARQDGAGQGPAAAGGTLDPPTGVPNNTGSTGAVRSGTGQRAGGGGGGSLGNQTGLGNIGPETERERRAQEESEEATKRICMNDCR